MKNFTISIFSENTPGTLQRITILFTRRKLNIESLTVSETERLGISRFTIVVKAEREIVEKVTKQIARIIEVIEAKIFENDELIAREIALFEIAPRNGGEYTTLNELAHRTGATVTSHSAGALVIEKTGPEEEVTRLYERLQAFDVRQFVRSGRIALNRGFSTS